MATSTPRASSTPPTSSEALGSSATKSESRQTMLCAYLSAALLVGLGLNALAGWWWADPITALAIATVAVKEGRDSWRGEACCTAPPLWLDPTGSLRRRLPRLTGDRPIAIRTRIPRRVLISATFSGYLRDTSSRSARSQTRLFAGIFA